MKNQNKILFFGELSPNIIHGISLSNRLNIDLLSTKFHIEIVEEKTDLNEHNKRNSSKIKKILFYLKNVFKLNQKNKYHSFYTVFSLSSFGSIKTYFSILIFKLSGKGNIVLHIHRGDFEQFYNKSFLNTFISKLIFKNINKLIVLSPNQKKEFSKYFFKTKIYVLENSLSYEYKSDKKYINSKKFIYISNYIKEKGIFELLEVFKKYEDKYLECFGGFVNNENEIRNYESNNVKINSFINGKEKYKKINESDALILPSWNEGQPTIILEAMMLGTIILTTKVGLITELLGEDYPFYFEVKNKESLIECIDRFVVYKEKNQLSEKLKKIYFDNYSKEIHKEKLLKIFEE